MENTGTLCTAMVDCSLPQEQSPWSMSAFKRTFSSGEWEKEAAIKDNVIIVEKVGIWPMCALLNIKLQQKWTKRKREKLYSYKLLTSLIQPYNLFYFY